MLEIKFSACHWIFFCEFWCFFTTSPIWKKKNRSMNRNYPSSTWVLNKALKLRRNSLDQFRGIVAISLKNTLLRKTRLKVQIRLPQIKFWLTVNLLSAIYFTLYLDANYAKKNSIFWISSRYDPLKRKYHR